jgi:glucose-6-phosphate-specific signal transduction histidine kinase
VPELLGPTAGTARTPWFQRRPALVVAIAAVLFAGVLALRLAEGSSSDLYSLFYALPIALLATAFGLRGGVIGGAVAVGLIGLWTVLAGVSLDAAGWLSRVVPLLLLGVLVGQANDRARTAEVERHRFATAALLHRQAIEVNDSLVQGLTAAKWSLEAGQVDSALRLLDQTIRNAEELVSELIRRAGMGSRAEVVGSQEPVS